MNIYLPLIAVLVQCTGLFLVGLYFLRREKESEKTAGDLAIRLREIRSEMTLVVEHLEELAVQMAD